MKEQAPALLDEDVTGLPKVRRKPGRVRDDEAAELPQPRLELMLVQVDGIVEIEQGVHGALDLQEDVSRGREDGVSARFQ